MRQYFMNKILPRILRYYETSQGKIPFLEWLNGIKDSTTRYRIRLRLDRLELGNLGDCKPVGDGILELRLPFGPGYRIYFSEIDQEIVILLCAGDKSSQKRDIQLAKQYWFELKERP